MEQAKTIELDFTTLEFYSRYVVSKVREDILISKQQVQEMVQACLEFYDGHKFAYISLRLYDYNVDPTIYYNINIKNLAGIAIVSTRASSLKMAEFEQKFSKVPFEVFTELEEAKQWVEEVI